MKTAERQLARRLRRDDGLSIKEIARAVGVSRSSVSLWVRDIELTEAQREALLERNAALNRQARGNEVWAEHRREQRRSYQAEGRRLARRGEALHAAGSMLFWAEGAKHRNALRFANSDPELVRFFVRFLRCYFVVPDEAVRVTCNLFADHADRQREIEDFWLGVLDLPRSSLCKSIVNVYSKHSQKKRRNRLPYGTCHLVVHDTRITQTLWGSIQEYGGFTREEWLG